MDDLMRLGAMLEVDVCNSPPKNKKSSKRKAENDQRKVEKDPHPLYKKSKSILKGMKATELHTILQTDFRTFCQDQGLLAKSIKCFCNEDMKLEQSRSKTNPCFWVCRKNGHFKKQGLKKGTFFENSHMPIVDILWIMYMWVYRYSTGLMMHECNNGPNSIIGWCRRCVEVCQMILEVKNEPLGGEQKVVEISECKFNDEKLEKKYEDKWAFCALEQGSTKSLFIIVDDKASDTILQIFSKYILPGTTIASLFWSPYINLTENDFKYLTKQRSLSFYHSTTKVTMNSFDEFVEGVNRHQPLTHLVKNEYEASFFEKMYRKSLYNAPDAYLAFLKDVALVYKPLQVAVKMEPKVEQNDDDD